MRNHENCCYSKISHCCLCNVLGTKKQTVLEKLDAPGILGLHFNDVAAPPAIEVVISGNLQRLVHTHSLSAHHRWSTHLARPPRAVLFA
jgi:hypothetical protein